MAEGLRGTFWFGTRAARFWGWRARAASTRLRTAAPLANSGNAKPSVRKRVLDESGVRKRVLDAWQARTERSSRPELTVGAHFNSGLRASLR